MSRAIDWNEFVKNEVSQTTFSRGLNYFNKKNVTSVQAAVSEAAVLIRSKTKGSYRNSYQQNIEIYFHNDEPVRLSGMCSCPVGYNCKHVVAAVLEYAKRQFFQQQENELACFDWLDSLDETEQNLVDPGKDFIAYVLYENTKNGQIAVGTVRTREKKTGGLTKGKQIFLYTVLDETTYSYSSLQVLPEDKEIVSMLMSQLESRYSYKDALLEGVLGGLALMKIVNTGRAFWADHQGTPLFVSAERKLELNWVQTQSGEFKLQLQAGPKTHILPLEPPFYLDGEEGLVGHLDAGGLSGRQLQKLLTMPPVPEKRAEEFSQRLLVEHPELLIPPPVEIELRDLADARFRPHIVLRGDRDLKIHYMELIFDYDGIKIQTPKPETVTTVKTDSGFVRVFRNLDQEMNAVETLTKAGFVEGMLDQRLCLSNPVNSSVIDKARCWSDFLEKTIPELEQADWIVEVDESFELDFQNVQNFDAEIEQTDNDWFQMSFNVMVNGQPMPLLPLIVPVLEHYDLEDLPETVTIPVNEHQFINIESEQIRPFLEILYELFDSMRVDEQGNARVSRFDAALVSEMDEHCYGLFSMKGGEQLIETGRKLRDFSGLTEAPVPKGLKAELRDYQKTGLNWMQFLREYHFGGILADDMGLGKTVQTLAHLLLEKESGRMDKPCLIVAPTSLMSNWKREAQRFTPNLKVLVLQGADRKQKFKDIAEHDLVLTTYPLLPRDKEFLLEHHYYYLILDEAQVIKNPKAQASQIVRTIPADNRLSLTGTPMENHLGELWAQFDFLMPGFLGNQETFKKQYRTPIEVHGDAVQNQKLSKRIKPFMLRRTKQEVIAELPEKTEIIRSVPLHDKQAALYESIRVAMEEKVRKTIAEKGLARSHIMILDALLKLRQTCCDPRIVSLDKAKKIKQSAKMDLLLEMLDELLEEGRKILVFSSFTKMLGLIETELKSRNISYTKLTGQTRKRDEAIERFKQGKVDVFLISLKAGGVGLNLTEADTVIIYDPWWNPAVESQAADRVYRIGQDKAVFVYKLITEETVEEKIIALQEKKRALAEGVYREGSKAEKFELTSEDLDELFKPLGA